MLFWNAYRKNKCIIKNEQALTTKIECSPEKNKVSPTNLCFLIRYLKQCLLTVGAANGVKMISFYYNKHPNGVQIVAFFEGFCAQSLLYRKPFHVLIRTYGAISVLLQCIEWPIKCKMLPLLWLLQFSDREIKLLLQKQCQTKCI